MTYRLYGMSSSGNCHKVRLLLTQLGLTFEWVEVDILKGESRTPEFLSRNPNGKVPALEIGPGDVLAESNAMLYFLAEPTPLWPSGRRARAEALQWMFFEQYSHEPYIAVARFICKFLPADHSRRAELPRLLERGHAALALMESHLKNRAYFVADQYSIADIALYAYTHCAGDGGFDLDGYPATMAWLARVEQQPGFIPMPAG